jgi:hypothetical protein
VNSSDYVEILFIYSFDRLCFVAKSITQQILYFVCGPHDIPISRNEGSNIFFLCPLDRTSSSIINESVTLIKI